MLYEGMPLGIKTCLARECPQASASDVRAHGPPCLTNNAGRRSINNGRRW